MNRRRLASVVGLLALAAFSTSAAASQAPGQSAPSSVSAPSISGTAAVGQTLTADSGSWSGPVGTISFQWSRCDASGGACGAVAGSTGSSYSVTGADVGYTLRVTVTASNKNGSTLATSAATGVVPAPSSGTTSTTSTTTTTTTKPTTTTTTGATTTTAPTTTTTTTTTPSSGPSGLVAAYAFNEGSGTTVADASGNGNNGSIQNATWTTSGKYGNALVFNGVNARVNVPDSASLHLGSAMTLEAWVDPAAVTSAWRDVIYKGNDNYYLEGTSTTGSGPAGGGTFTGVNGNAYAGSALPVNAWSYVAVTYDGATLRLYVNGSLVASQARTGSLATSSNQLQVGGDGIYGQYFNGAIDEVRVYSSALTGAQVQTDMATPIGASAPTTTTGTSTTTQTSTTTATTTTTTTTSSPSGSIYFDSRATKMSVLYSYETTPGTLSTLVQGQSPSLFACLCFLNNDFAVASDSRFGKAYSITTGPSSHNPWWNPPYGVASSENTARRPVRLGQWDWYANSFKALSGWTLTDWGTVDQMNYPTITSPPLEIDFDKYGVGIDRAVGYVASVGGSPQINDVQRWFSVSSVIGKWVDFVIGVKWATDTTGSIRVYTRCRECGDTDWVLRYSKDNIITMQYGAGVMTAQGTDPSTGQPLTTLDKQGLYWGYYTGNAPSTLPTDHILEMGMVRASDEATAKAAIP